MYNEGVSTVEEAEFALAKSYVSLPCVSSNLWYQEVNAERCILIMQSFFYLCNLYNMTKFR